MSYHKPVFGTIAMAGVDDKVGKGDEVLLRFTPGPGTNGPRGDRVAYALKQLVIGTGHFKTPKRASWGADANAGLIIVRADTKSDNYSLQQIANFMPALAARAQRETGVNISFASASNESGDEAFARTAGGQTALPRGGAFEGMTQDQVAQWALLDRTVKMLAERSAKIFGTAPPRATFNDILNFNFNRIVGSLLPFEKTRSLILYANAQNAKALLQLPGLMREQTRGSQTAANLVNDISRGIRESSEKIAQVLAKFESYVPRQSGTSGLGEIVTFTVGTSVVVITAVDVAIIIAAIAFVLVGIHWYLTNMKTNIERAIEYCKMIKETQGRSCTKAEADEYLRTLPPDASQTLANAGNRMAEGAGDATRVILIGGAVMLVGYAAFQVFAATGGFSRLKERASEASTRVKTSVSAVGGRVKTRARELGGRVRGRLGSGSAPRALPASIEQ